MKIQHTQSESRIRSGATLVEAAIVTPVLLMLIFGIFDIGIGVLRRNMMAEAARMGARESIHHGADSPEPWSSPTAETKIAEIVDPLLKLSGLRPEQYSVKVTYTNGNEPGEAVEVEISTEWAPILGPFVGGSGSEITLAARSVMVISN